MEENRYTEKRIPFGEYETYARIYNENGKKTPLLFLHGGPGGTCSSYYFLGELAYLDDRPFIFYDQIGCGESSIPDDKPELYRLETWLDELENIRSKLSLRECYIIGHSWGGMLLISYLIDRKPTGVKGAVLASTLASSKLWDEETHKLLLRMSEEDQAIIKEAENTGVYEGEAWNKAIQRYSFLFQGSPKNPYEPKRKFGKLSYNVAWGPSEFRPLGNLKDFDYLDRLHLISVPTLILYGENDESTRLQNEAMHDRIPSSAMIVYPFARHATYKDCPLEFSRDILRFMNEADK